MPENRRFTDQRMEKMEHRLEKIEDSVGAIREKIYNGFSEAIVANKENIHEIQKSIKSIDETLARVRPVVERTPEEVLANCPLKKHIQKILWIFIALLIANIPSWVSLFVNLKGAVK